MLSFNDAQRRWPFTLSGSMRRKIPPSFPIHSEPSVAKAKDRESAWGDVPWAAAQTTLTHEDPVAVPRNTFALKLMHPFAFGEAGRSWRSPAMKTTLGSVGCAAIAPWTLPCAPGKISGGRPMDVQELP